MAHEFLGWIGALLFCFCAVPQVIKAYRTKKTEDLSWVFLLMWLFGEVLTLIYVVGTNMAVEKFQWPLIANYIMNMLLVMYLVYAKGRYG
jgi:uncharacterized protein with PQ loop repeat